jgi:hypothetical protein
MDSNESISRYAAAVADDIARAELAAGRPIDAPTEARLFAEDERDPVTGYCLCGRPEAESRSGYCSGFLSGAGPCTTQPV